MGKLVTVETKKDFLRRFVRMYKLKQSECDWILSYLLASETLLKKVRFVEDINGSPRGMIISSTHANEDLAFRYQRGNMWHTDVKQAILDVRSNLEEDLYLHLNFPGRMELPSYLAVLENSPFINTTKEERKDVSVEAKKEALLLIAFMRKLYLEKETNRALDEKNKTLFEKIQKTITE